VVDRADDVTVAADKLRMRVGVKFARVLFGVVGGERGVKINRFAGRPVEESEMSVAKSDKIDDTGGIGNFSGQENGVSPQIRTFWLI